MRRVDMRPERWLFTIPLRLRSFFRRAQADQELDDELRDHVARKTEEYLAKGLPPGEARRQAFLEMGGIEKRKEECREIRRVNWIQDLAQDLRYGLRMLRKSPGFTAVAILTLALGIGANTAIFSLTNQVLLRLLPVPHPEQLVVLSSSGVKNGYTAPDYGAGVSVTFSYPMYKGLRGRNQVLSGLLACFSVDANVSWNGHADKAGGELVSGNFFQVLGVLPAIGRVFSSQDETAPGANPVAVLSYAYWKRHFGGSHSILNQSLQVNGTPLTVVGIAQLGFTGVQTGAEPDIYIPITMKPQMTPGWNGLDSASDYFLALIGRLKPGITRQKAQTGLQPLYGALLSSELPRMMARNLLDSPEIQKRFLAGKIALTPGEHGRPVLQYYLETPLILLTAVVGIILLIVCANLAGLLLARGEVRHHEMTVRLALGASPPRLIRQLLTESLMIAIVGGAAGLLVASLTLDFMVSEIPRGLGILGLAKNLDPRVLAFAAAATILSSAIFGLLPALRASRSNLRKALQEQGGSTSGGAENVRLRKLLIVAQVALTTTLLVAAALFGNSLMHLEDVNLGMNISKVVQFSIQPGLSGYSPAQTLALLDRLHRDIGAFPGVSSVSAAENTVLADSGDEDTFTFEGHPSALKESADTTVNSVGPGFFSTMGIPLIQGRTFRHSDSVPSPKVCVINEYLAQKFFTGHNPVGMHVAIGWGPNIHPNIEIVGVVANAKYFDARDPARPAVYFPYAQDGEISSATFYVRTLLAPRAVMASLRNLVAQDAPSLPIYGVETLAGQVAETMFGDRAMSFLTMSFGLLAALLAGVGLYGVMAYVVVRRTREIGIRRALGAPPRAIARTILWQAGLLAAIGLSLGLAAAFAVSRLLGSMLYGVKATDPMAFTLSALLLILVAFAACYIPARRAMHVDPMVALRYE
jgi:putative ABC transport system permease protein